MLQQHIATDEHIARLKRGIVANPERSTYRTPSGRSIIYIAGMRYVFDIGSHAARRQLGSQPECAAGSEK